MESLHYWNIDTYTAGLRDETTLRVTERNLTAIWEKLNELVQAFNAHAQQPHHGQEN